MRFTERSRDLTVGPRISIEETVLHLAGQGARPLPVPVMRITRGAICKRGERLFVPEMGTEGWWKSFQMDRWRSSPFAPTT